MIVIAIIFWLVKNLNQSYFFFIFHFENLNNDNYFLGSDDKSIRIWEVLTGKCLQKLEGHSEGVTSIAFSSDGLKIVSG